MKAFLSHSSSDKGFVEAVSDLLRPGTFELDSMTFDAGLVNSDAIIDALARSDIFCLFLSNNSAQSSYVDFETLLGVEFFARGGIRKFLAICIDEEAFSEASSNVKFFNVVRRSLTVESTSRLIQGNLVSASTVTLRQSHPFLGRRDEIADLEGQVTDHNRPLTKGIFISGNFGAGRKTLAQKFYEDQYPQVGRIFPIINIEPYSGHEEIYRRVLIALRPAMTAAELKIRTHGFSIAPVDEKFRLIGQLLNSLLPANEAAFLVDMGGVLTDAGGLEAEIDGVISQLNAKPHPPVVVIARRMIPRKLRRPQDDISYLPLRSLGREAAERLVSRLLKDRGIVVADEQRADLVSLADGHPFNFYRMIDEVEERGAGPFLANPSDFIEWKHRQSSEYLSKIPLCGEDVLILGLLELVPELDFTAISAALPIDPASASEALFRLANLHVVEPNAERFMVSPALRVAVERDKRIVLPKGVRTSAIRTLATTLSVRLEEGTAPIALVDSAVLSALESGGDIPGYAAAFLLPSHYVTLSKRRYDERNYDESIRLSKEALKGADRLSSSGLVAACRFMCLAAARTGIEATFDEGITLLEASAKDNWGRSNVSYLKGFNLRMKGNVPQAEEHFRKAYEFSPGNAPAAREIAAICLERGNLQEAEIYAREAHSQATSNPFCLDMLISVLVRRYGRSSKHSSEIDSLFEALKKTGEEDGKSFFTTRRAEFEHFWGNNRTALKLIEEAISRTPHIFEPRRLHVEILLKEGNRTKAYESIRFLDNKVNSRDPSERRSNYRLFLETYAHYLTEVGKYIEAKNLYDDASVFTEKERKEAVRQIEIVQGYKSV
jgi:tetratricopeptide (TPR) repeat protein